MLTPHRAACRTCVPFLRRHVSSYRYQPMPQFNVQSLARHAREGGTLDRPTRVRGRCRLNPGASTRCASGSLFFARAQRKVTKRKGPFPEEATARRSNGQEDFPTRHPASTENGAHPCAPPYGSCRWWLIKALSPANAQKQVLLFRWRAASNTSRRRRISLPYIQPQPLHRGRPGPPPSARLAPALQSCTSGAGGGQAGARMGSLLQFVPLLPIADAPARHQRVDCAVPGVTPAGPP
jgi:hypothetical protein